jgi:hypothetical protein
MALPSFLLNGHVTTKTVSEGLYFDKEKKKKKKKKNIF